MQYSTRVRDAQNDAFETIAGASAVLKIFSGAKPTNCAAANTGTILATVTLPADWLGNSAAGLKSMIGTWQDPSADAAGTAGYFRIFNATDSVCDQQGTITATGGGGDMTLDNVNFALGQPFSITSYSIQRGNG